LHALMYELVVVMYASGLLNSVKVDVVVLAFLILYTAYLVHRINLDPTHCAPVLAELLCIS